MMMVKKVKIKKNKFTSLRFMLMKPFVLFFLLYLYTPYLYGQELKRRSGEELMAELKSDTSTLAIINFWATWCRPCVEELPVFEKANQDYQSKGVRIILANVDFNSKVDTLVLPFIRFKKMQSELMHLTDPDPNGWINKIDSNWSGAIPFTAFFRNGKMIFSKEGEMKMEELMKQIEISLK